MKNAYPGKAEFRVDVLGMRLDVFRAGNTPHLIRRASPETETDSARRFHSHFTYEVFFVTDGKLNFVTESGSKTCERRVIIIPQRMRHYSVPDGDGSYCLLFSFDGPKDSPAAFLNKRLQQKICELPMTDDIAFYIRKIAEKNDSCTAVAERESELLVSLVFHALICLLLPERSALPARQSRSKHIGAIETYINANCTRRLTLTELAHEVYLSPRQVSRILQREYGAPLSRILTDKRLATACMLLKNTDLSIGDIARQVCIGSENYFYSLFRSRFGMTPLKYRQAQRKKGI